MHDDDYCPFDIHLREADYSIFGDYFYEDVAIIRELEGRLFWLNADWFRSHEIDVGHVSTRKQVERWILELFSVRSCEGKDAGEASARADRYGGLNGTAHGGSGRCVYRGRFNVKGVGRTPLVPAGLGSHTNGEYLLVEAIRGAVYSELAHYESIAGAIRTIAIIQLPPYDVPPQERRCLIVRQNFIRPAHFERSLLFGTAGFKGSDQFKDHKRVQAVRQILSKRGVGWQEITKRLAKQMGSLDAMRMSQGRFTSSNMSLAGEVADFETFRVFDSWYYTKQVNRDQHVFGKELELLWKSSAKWSRILDRPEGGIPETTRNSHRDGFVETMRLVVPSANHHGTSPRDRLIDFLYGTFLSHSKLRLVDSDEWLVAPDITSEEFGKRMTALAGTFGFGEAESAVVAARMNAWRLSRSSIALRELNSIACDLISIADENPELASSRIDAIIWKNRRIFRFDNDNVAPILSRRRDDACFLYVVDVRTRKAHKLRWSHGFGGIRDNADAAVGTCSRDEIYDEILDAKAETPLGSSKIYNEWIADQVR